MDANLHIDGRRAGALWVTATGAFLLVAAAALFVAVQWGRMPDTAKLALVGALTGACCLGGRALRRSLPATGDVVFHLGAFLIPVDVAAVAVRAHLGWRGLLLAEGVVAACAFGAMAVGTGSAVLAWAAAGAGIALATGMAAVSALPAALVLAAAAVVLGQVAPLVHGGRLGNGADFPAPTAGTGPAPLTRPACIALVWAAIAGLAPALGALATALVDAARGVAGAGVLEELGLAGRGQQLSALASGALAAFVLAKAAARRRDLSLALLACTAALVGAGATWSAADVGPAADQVAAAALFATVELLALALWPDPFWSRAAGWVAAAAEVVAGVAALVTTAYVLVFPAVAGHVRPHGAAGFALALAAGGWLAADLRRRTGGPRLAPGAGRVAGGEGTGPQLGAGHLSRLARSTGGLGREGGSGLGAGLLVGGGWPPATAAFALSAVGAVALATASTAAVAVALAAVAAVLVVSGRPFVEGAAVPLAVWAPVTAWSHPAVAAVAGTAAAAVLAWGAVARSSPAGRARLAQAHVLAVAAVCDGLLAVAVSTRHLDGRVGSCLAVAACWALATALDHGGAGLGWAARGGIAVAVTGAVLTLPAASIVPVAALATLAFAVEAARIGVPEVGVGASLTVQLVLGHGGTAVGLTRPQVGLALCMAAVAWSGLAAVVEFRWRPPLFAAAAAGTMAGVLLAWADPGLLGDALIVAGAMVVAGGVGSRSVALGHTGGVVATVGVAVHLAAAGVTASEPFVAPVAAQLVAAGVLARRRAARGGDEPVGSWLAYGPAVALLGGAALAERVGGGAGWHALVAGAVGVAAVVAGGGRRLAGPLFLGTTLLVAVTAYESLGALAGVPTWSWLALGGAVLVGAGVALERGDTSPVEAGRRVVDVVAERFS